MSLALPTEWVFSNYSEVIEKGSLIQGFLNSFAYALIATTLGVVLCSMAAFVMCRKRTKIECIPVLLCTLRTVLPGQLCNIGTCTQYTAPERYKSWHYHGIYQCNDSVLCIYHP